MIFIPHNDNYYRLASSAGYYGLSLAVGGLAGNRYLNQLISSVVELVAFASVIFVLKLWVYGCMVSGRKLTGFNLYFKLDFQTLVCRDYCELFIVLEVG